MKKNIQFYTGFLLLTILYYACHKDVISPLTYGKDMIILGSGGGFTGAMSQYYLLENGLVFRSGNTDTTFTELGKFSNDKTNQLFETYQVLNFDQQNLDEPGNRYYFMVHKDSDGKEHKLQWGYRELSNKGPEIFHKNFMTMVQKLESSTANSSK